MIEKSPEEKLVDIIERALADLTPEEYHRRITAAIHALQQRQEKKKMYSVSFDTVVEEINKMKERGETSLYMSSAMATGKPEVSGIIHCPPHCSGCHDEKDAGYSTGFDEPGECCCTANADGTLTKDNV